MIVWTIFIVPCNGCAGAHLPITRVPHRLSEGWSRLVNSLRVGPGECDAGGDAGFARITHQAPSGIFHARYQPLCASRLLRL